MILENELVSAIPDLALRAARSGQESEFSNQALQPGLTVTPTERCLFLAWAPAEAGWESPRKRTGQQPVLEADLHPLKPLCHSQPGVLSVREWIRAGQAASPPPPGQATPFQCSQARELVQPGLVVQKALFASCWEKINLENCSPCAG